MEEILAARNAVTEGVATAPALARLADDLGVDMPICQTVADIVAGGISPQEAVTRLLSRPLKDEG
jgi:glycerol-3-phosphate dehydrogenase (NAD(P)+)